MELTDKEIQDRIDALREAYEGALESLRARIVELENAGSEMAYIGNCGMWPERWKELCEIFRPRLHPHQFSERNE